MNTANTTIYKNETVGGVLYAVAAYGMWGVLPLYWKALKQVPAAQILSHRIFWSFIFVFLTATIYKRWKLVREALLHKRYSLLIFFTALLISCNWFIYIWAVNAGHVVEASLGYYINPLLSVVFGVVFLKERLNFWQLVALILALTGVLVMTLKFGRVPWIALSLAMSFGLYGLVKKTTNVDALTALLLETGFVAPVALGYLVFEQAKGIGPHSMASVPVTLLLMGSGIVTALPLLWFAQSVRRIPLSTVGFIQYLAPSISLFLGIVIFGEPFTKVHVISFSFIWLAVALFSFSKSGFMLNRQPRHFGVNQ